ncbi:MAG: hypothetical protein R3362_13130, partial [Rhodothermales bacterium]|nr:hypothetical protein [Rhodothermales bacterium]
MARAADTVLFFVSFWDEPYLQAWPMELIHRHLERGDEVRVVKCRASLPTCFALKTHRDPVLCLRCASRARYALRRTGVARANTSDVVPQPEAEAFEVPDFADVEALKGLSVGGVNLGYGVAASLISGLRDHDFDLREHRKPVEANVRAALHAFYFFKRYLAEHDVHRVYVFNGRFSEVRPLVELCKRAGIPFSTYEVGRSPSHFQVFHDTFVHDIPANVRAINALWAGASEASGKRAIAARWYEDRRGGVRQAHLPVFTGGQEHGRLPAEFDPSRRNIAVFNSSEDEFAALGEVWVNPLYRDQSEALAGVLERVGPETGVRFYLRTHPNLAQLDNAQTRALDVLEASHLTVLPGDGPTDT